MSPQYIFSWSQAEHKSIQSEKRFILNKKHIITLRQQYLSRIVNSPLAVKAPQVQLHSDKKYEELLPSNTLETRMPLILHPVMQQAGWTLWCWAERFHIFVCKCSSKQKLLQRPAPQAEYLHHMLFVKEPRTHSPGSSRAVGQRMNCQCQYKAGISPSTLMVLW